MGVGQAAITSAFDVGALDAAELALEVRAVDRCARHGQLLREVLELHRVLSSSGAGLSTVPQTALLLQLSELAAAALLAEAQLLVGLPGALEALDCGLLTVEQSAVLLRSTGHLEPAVQHTVWQRLQARLLDAADGGAVLPPARLGELVRRWVVAADPGGAARRRQQAEAAGDVAYRRREDGVGDLIASGIPAPLLRAVLCRIRDHARPFGAQDERSAGKRRVDALVDLVLGRACPPAPSDQPAADPGVPAGGSCGCRAGTPVPCGAAVTVVVPLGAALGTTDELADLVGSGPLHPDELARLLLRGPRLRAVTVDDAGVPVAVGSRVRRPPPGDPVALRTALLELTGAPPGPAHPRHPLDHPDPGPARTARHRRGPDADPPPRSTLPRVHPPDLPGGYRPGRDLSRLVRARAPRCEWPGCGVRAAACDLDHDRAHPAGPTCACNLGPLCRRHHRVKQLLMSKRRTAAGVVWTDPTGRRWTSPAQHGAPAPELRDLTPVVADPLPAAEDALSPDALAELLAAPDDDVTRFDLRCEDLDPDDPRSDEDEDRLAARILGDTGWGLALDDPSRWVA